MADRGAVLITRPEPGASETARRIAADGWSPLVAPMLTLHQQPLALAEDARPQAVLVTSASALPALPGWLHGIKLLAVGDATAAAASRAGFADVASAHGDAADLRRLVEATCRPNGGTLLLAVASGQGMELAEQLRASGFAVDRRNAYETRAVAALPPAALEALERGMIAVALFFSPATGRAFVATMEHVSRPLVSCIDAIVISPATASAIAPLPWRRIRVASRPNQDDMLALLNERSLQADRSFSGR